MELVIPSHDQPGKQTFHFMVCLLFLGVATIVWTVGWLIEMFCYVNLTVVYVFMGCECDRIGLQHFSSCLSISQLSPGFWTVTRRASSAARFSLRKIFSQISTLERIKRQASWLNRSTSVKACIARLSGPLLEKANCRASTAAILASWKYTTPSAMGPKIMRNLSRRTTAWLWRWEWMSPGRWLIKKLA